MAAACPLDTWEHERLVKYIQRHNFTRITLQFPDDLLQHAPSVAQELQQLLLNKGSAAKVGHTDSEASFTSLPFTAHCNTATLGIDRDVCPVVSVCCIPASTDQCFLSSTSSSLSSGCCVTSQSPFTVTRMCCCCVSWQVYVLADTSYNPLSIDEVAAAHVKADCVVSP
jgi:diphthamide biosynthesis protein 2